MYELTLKSFRKVDESKILVTESELSEWSKSKAWEHSLDRIAI